MAFNSFAMTFVCHPAMPLDSGNLFDSPITPQQCEESTTLYQHGRTRIERIASHRHASPEGFWYDQDTSEWVAVLQGEATLEFADAQLLEMRAGDWVAIPAHVLHRVRHTGPATVWLAVHAGESID